MYFVMYIRLYFIFNTSIFSQKTDIQFEFGGVYVITSYEEPLIYSRASYHYTQAWI